MKKPTAKPNGLAKIDKGVPIPTSYERGKWPWRQLKVGDSFLMSPRARRGAHTAAHRHGIKIVTRAEGKFSRVWRVK